jgi:hypothetical protein
LPRPRSRSHPPTSMAAPRRSWLDNGSVAATCPAARTALLQTNRSTSLRSIGHSRRLLRNGPLWQTDAFSRRPLSCAYRPFIDRARASAG